MYSFNENNSLFGFDGILNRRNYIVNILIVEAIVQSLIATPLLIAVFMSNNLTGAILGGGTMPKWWYFVMCVSSFLSSVMYMPSIVRRFRDIMGNSGKDDVKSFAIFTFIILILSIPASFTQDMFLASFKFIGLIILISLACIRGKVTGFLPKSPVAEFNWGAFIGTWIWGLFNKSFKTLWALPLSFTMGALPFYIVCGLKGNEWAYEKSKNKDIQTFHSKQKIQTIIWTVILPVISFVFIIFGSIFVYKFVSGYTKSHPDFTKQAVEYYVNTESKAAVSKFNKIELGADEYKFYIDPKKWANSSYKEKMADFDMASGYVMLQTLNDSNIIDAFSNASTSNIMNKIKIYSTYNDELLGEYHLDPEVINEFMDEIKNNPDVKNNPEIKNKLLDKIKKGYRFNSHPALP